MKTGVPWSDKTQAAPWAGDLWWRNHPLRVSWRPAVPKDSCEGNGWWGIELWAIFWTECGTGCVLFFGRCPWDLRFQTVVSRPGGCTCVNYTIVEYWLWRGSCLYYNGTEGCMRFKVLKHFSNFAICIQYSTDLHTVQYSMRARK